MSSVNEKIQNINSYVSFAHEDTYETRIRHYFKDMNRYYKTENDLPELKSNIFIYYFIISVESCDKKVDVVLSDPNFYFYKNKEQKLQKYISIDGIRKQIKTEFDNTSLEHPHFSAVDYIVIEKYTKDAKDRYFLMKTRDFENTFCYVEKIKTTLRTSDVVDIMTILIMSKDNSNSETAKRGGGKLYTDVSVRYRDDDPVYYIQYQLLQRLGLDTYNTIAAMIQDKDNPVPFFTKKNVIIENKETEIIDGINKDFFNNNTITTRFTKICHSDTDQYVADLHNKLKGHIITKELMTEIYDVIANATQIKDLVFGSDNEKALITTYIQLLIEKWIDLYITIELNKELYVSNKLNNTASDNSTKIDEVNNYMITQSSCKIDIIKYQLYLLYYLKSLQKPRPPVAPHRPIKKPPSNNFVNKIDKQINEKYISESYFRKLQTALNPVAGTPPDLPLLNNTLTEWLENMKVQPGVIATTIKVVNEYISTDAANRDVNTFQENIQKIRFGKPDMTGLNTEKDQSTVPAISDETASSDKDNSNTTGVSANAVDMNQFIPKMLLGLVNTASTSKPTKGNKIYVPTKNEDVVNTKSKPSKNIVKPQTEKVFTQPIPPRNVKTIDVNPTENNATQPTSAVSEKGTNIPVKPQVKATLPEEIINRVVDPIKSTIESDKNAKIELINTELSNAIKQIEEYVPSKHPTSDTDMGIEDLENSSNDTTVSEQEDKNADTEFYDTLKSQANKVFDDNKYINETQLDIASRMKELHETLNKIHTNRKNENGNDKKTANTEIKNAIQTANTEIDNAIETANNEIDNAIKKAIEKHKTKKGAETTQEKKTPLNPVTKQVRTGWT